MAYTTEQFLKKLKPYVLEDMRRSGILASLTAAQAIIESKRGNSGLTTQANNLFGIKGTYNGKYVMMWTTEYYNGAAQRVKAKFRKYPSWLESIEDHSAMFNRLKRYEKVRGCMDWRKAVDAVYNAGYATEPKYDQILKKAIESNKLYSWDMEALTGNPSAICPYREPINYVKYGSKGDSVRWLQWMLHNVGGFVGLEIDGKAGVLTISALMEFQKSQGLIFDGICGPLTRDKLKKEYEKRFDIKA